MFLAVSRHKYLFLAPIVAAGVAPVPCSPNIYVFVNQIMEVFVLTEGGSDGGRCYGFLFTSLRFGVQSEARGAGFPFSDTSSSRCAICSIKITRPDGYFARSASDAA